MNRRNFKAVFTKSFGSGTFSSLNRTVPLAITTRPPHPLMSSKLPAQPTTILVSISIVWALIMTIKGGTSQACAACKYQRRRCSKDCALAPYFPADQPKMFQNAHRLFGVCNIMKILRQVHASQKDETMTSIIYESNMRARFPVHGCCGVLWQLHYQIQQVAEELRQVRTRLAMFKDQFIPGMAEGNFGSNDMVYPIYTQQQQQQQLQQYNSGLLVNQATDGNDLLFGNVNSGGIYLDNDDNNGLMLKDLRIQQHYNDNYGINISNVDSMLMQSNLIPTTVQGYPLQQEMEISHDYDEIPFDTIADDRQSYIESKEACDSRYVIYFIFNLKKVEKTNGKNWKNYKMGGEKLSKRNEIEYLMREIMKKIDGFLGLCMQCGIDVQRCVGSIS